MGVPKFYRWLSERYPCLSEVVMEYQIPEFDNLYLDMNGIIHLCSHPNDDDPKFRITEEKIMRDISHYIEALFRLINPKKVFFMAVDGVAPRAKMNQQRGRRFRSAREALESEQRAIQRGDVLPTDERFDSNCITPGTPFMRRLQDHLKYFISKKISTDRSWHRIRIYLSGHNTPGEGEHKIMDFIRSEKARPDYDPNTRHCLYGLDADLIMLGMCTHDPHFSLLREEVRFTGKKSQKRIPTVEETTFHLLHLSLLRDYLDHEFSSLKTKLQFPYDIEKIIDDWIMMGFLVGNDFIPNLPHLHIVNGSLSRLYQTYMDILPTIDGYINESGFLNLKRFEKYMAGLAQVDHDHFEEFFSDFKWLESRKPNNDEVWSSKRVSIKKQLEPLKLATKELFSDDDDGSVEDTETGVGNVTEKLTQMEFYQNKRDYYTNKLNYPQLTEDVLREQAEVYVRAIQWTLHYYYNGVCSWGWYYPHHYAPFISDIKNFSHLHLEFELGEPFLPFQQLLAVLPSASKQFLPKAYQSLMCDENSPLIDYYPINFETDLNGKQQDWEAVVLLPFIDEKRLLEAMNSLNGLLTMEERQRNSCSSCLLFTNSSEPLGLYLSYWPSIFPNIDINYAKCEEIPPEVFRVEPDKLVKGLSDKIHFEICYLGFPTLRHISHRSYLKKAEVRVFQQNSRGESMILEIENKIESSAKEMMEKFVGGCVYVGWPHLSEAKVVSVSNSQCRYVGSTNNQVDVQEMNDKEVKEWYTQAASVKEHYMKRWGIQVGDIQILIHVNQLVGSKKVLNKSGKIIVENQYSKRAVPYAVQAVIKDLTVMRSLEAPEALTVEQLFPLKSSCFLLTPTAEYYGREADIIRIIDNGKKGVLIEVNMLEVLGEPDLQQFLDEYQNYLDEYSTPRVACHRLGISCRMLSRITSMLHISSYDQKINIGLNMKSVKRNEEMPGYTRKTDDGWNYSREAIKTVEDYLMKFPQLFEFLAGHPATTEMLQEEDLNINCPDVSLSDVHTYLKSLPSYSINCCPCGSEFIPEFLTKSLENALEAIDNRKSLPSKVLSVRPNQIYVPCNVVTLSGDLPPDPSSYISLLDRVIYVKEGGVVPLGLKGTVVGITSGENEMYEVLFDSTFEGAFSLRGFSNKIYRLQKVHIINISYCLKSRRLESDPVNNRKPTAVVHPHLATAKNQAKTSVVTRIVRRDGIQSAKQTVVARGQPPTRTTGINHSPNSPFVPSKPYFYTPSMTIDHKTATAPPPFGNRDGEFQEMWKQLQSSKKKSRKSAGVGGSPALIEAAKSLPKPRMGNQSAPGGQLKGGYPSAQPSSKPSQEFACFLQALEHQPTNIPAKDKSLDSLLQQLKLNEVEVKEQPTHVQPGQSIPLEELFKKPNEAKPQLQYQRKDFNQFSNSTSHVITLMNLSQQLMRGVPMYTYNQTPEKLIIARVTLPNGFSTQSRPCQTQQEAAEIAAYLAKQELTALQNNVESQKMAPVRPLLLPSPFVPQFARPPLLPTPLIFQPNAQSASIQQPQQYQALRAAPWNEFHHFQTPQVIQPLVQHMPMHRVQVPKNPFVPLQVTKQSKSTKGGTTPCALSATNFDGSEAEAKQPAPSRNRTASSSEDTKAKFKPKGKRKSKLAINLNGALN